jgi:hypothetical protein
MEMISGVKPGRLSQRSDGQRIPKIPEFVKLSPFELLAVFTFSLKIRALIVTTCCRNGGFVMITHAKLVLLSVGFLIALSVLHTGSIANPARARAVIAPSESFRPVPVQSLTGIPFRVLSSSY